MKYLANFAEEIGGKPYQPGDEINVKSLGDDAEGTIAYLVRAGRVTSVDDGDAKVTATGGDEASETTHKGATARK